jgi:hypothetical protein
MKASDLFNNSNSIYLELASRYVRAGNDNFPVPEFGPTNQKIAAYFEEMTKSGSSGEQQDQPWQLKPLTMTLEDLQKGAASEDEKYQLQIYHEDVSKLVNDFNEQVTRQCLLARYEAWKAVVQPNSEVTYRNFWTGFYFFAESITEPCSERVEPKLPPRYQYCARDGFCLPQFLKETPLANFNAIDHVPLHFVGVIDRPTPGDGIIFTPKEFVKHDVAHAEDATINNKFYKYGEVLRRAIESRRSDAEESLRNAADLRELSEPLLKSKTINGCIIHGAAESNSPRMVEELYFNYTHETGDHLEAISDKPLPKILSQADKGKTWKAAKTELIRIIKNCL